MSTSADVNSLLHARFSPHPLSCPASAPLHMWASLVDKEKVSLCSNVPFAFHLKYPCMHIAVHVQYLSDTELTGHQSRRGKWKWCSSGEEGGGRCWCARRKAVNKQPDLWHTLKLMSERKEENSKWQNGVGWIWFLSPFSAGSLTEQSSRPSFKCRVTEHQKCSPTSRASAHTEPTKDPKGRHRKNTTLVTHMSKAGNDSRTTDRMMKHQIRLRRQCPEADDDTLITFSISSCPTHTHTGNRGPPGADVWDEKTWWFKDLLRYKYRFLKNAFTAV